MGTHGRHTYVGLYFCSKGIRHTYQVIIQYHKEHTPIYLLLPLPKPSIYHKRSKRKTAEELGLQLILTLILLTTTQELTQDVAARDKVIHLLRRRATLLDDLRKTSKLLLSILLVLAELLCNLHIVLRVFVLQILDGLLDLPNKALEVARGNILANNIVKVSNGTSLLVKTTANSTVSAGLFVQEVKEGLLRAGALVGFGFLGALGEELDSGVSGDALFSGEGLRVFGFSVDLGDDDVGLGGEVVSEGFPGRSEALAVCGKVSNVNRENEAWGETYVHTTAP